MQYTTDTTREGQRRADNALREKLWADDVFAHRWLCHPESACTDGCTARASASRTAFYQSAMEINAMFYDQYAVISGGYQQERREFYPLTWDEAHAMARAEQARGRDARVTYGLLGDELATVAGGEYPASR